MNRFAADLLPPRSSLFVAHDEVLVVDACEVKVQHPTIDCRFPHQTGVTERSISRHDCRATDRVLHDVVISHQPYWISNRFVADRYRQHTIVIFNELYVTGFRVSRTGQWIEHPLEVILPRHPGGAKHWRQK